MNTALRLEADRCVICYIQILLLTFFVRVRLLGLVRAEDKSRADSVSVKRARAKLSRDLSGWRKTQLHDYPKLRDHIPLVDSSTPEEESLQLPSAFTPELRISLGLKSLATVEYNLREGQAYDSLQSLRQVIQEFNYNLLDKKNNVHGLSATLRSETFLRVFTSDKRAHAETYRRARDAMISLGLSETDSKWRELRDDEL